MRSLDRVPAAAVLMLLVVVQYGAGWSSVASAADGEPVPSPPIIAGYERFHAARPTDDLAGGELLAAELNCRSCHRGNAEFESPWQSKQAPVLDKVGERVRPEWIRQYLRDPHGTKPGTTMPQLPLNADPVEREAEILALTHFLATTGTLADGHGDQSAAHRGAATFRQSGCVACHGLADDPDTHLAHSVPLPKIDEKYTLPGLMAFLLNPLNSRPSGRMPALGLKEDEARDLAQYFLKDVKRPANVRFAVYEGSWEKLPDFDTLTPVATGECAGFDLSVAGRTNNFAIRFSTNFYSRSPAQHQFYLGSDDGSRLTIGGQKIVDVDGVHPYEEAKGRHSFEVGWHPVTVDFFQGGGEWVLNVELDGNGLRRQPLSGLVSLKTEGLPQPTSTFQVDVQLAARGRELFSSRGCANCHQLVLDGQRLVAGVKAPDWDQLRGRTGGCLAETTADVPATAPRYGLSQGQRQHLRAVAGQPAGNVTPTDVVHRTMVNLNCYGCHTRRDLSNEDELVLIGGVPDDRNALFQSKQPEMGDEGRLPPGLTGVGDKLRPDWLREILVRGGNDRQQYQLVRMPRFGEANVAHLVDAFRAIDRQTETGQRPEFTEPLYRMKAAGRQLVGGNALSCIKCHDFGPHPSQGVRAINLTTMTKRLNEDWFYRYMINPTAFRPGTRMPAPWPFGQSTIKTVLNGHAEQQMAAVWVYLQDGEQAAVPAGLLREPIELVPTSEPIIYRNFVDGAGSRAIAVGLPEKVHYAWDANDLRMALMWHGGFIDASRHWNGRGVGFEPPLGDDLIALPSGPAWAQLALPDDSWPTTSARQSGGRFRGYRLDAAQRPHFQYTWGALTVEESIEPLIQADLPSPGLRRQFTVKSATATAWSLRLLVAKELTVDGPNRFQVDKTWAIDVEGPQSAIVRESQGQKELLVPVTASPQPLMIRVDYEW
jgi:mono/diheme cytochrome c family protein